MIYDNNHINEILKNMEKELLYEKFFRACNNNDIEEAKEYLLDGLDANEIYDGATGFSYAYFNSDMQFLNELRYYSANKDKIILNPAAKKNNNEQKYPQIARTRDTYVYDELLNYFTNIEL